MTKVSFLSSTPEYGQKLSLIQAWFRIWVSLVNYPLGSDCATIFSEYLISLFNQLKTITIYQ